MVAMVMVANRLALPTDHAWAAGIVDGEGCVTIRKTRQLSGGVKKLYYALIVTVGQSGKAIPVMLIRLRELYGGQITPARGGDRDGLKRQPKWQWCVAHRGAETMLRLISGYSVQKSDQISVALEYRAVAMGRGKVGLAQRYYKRLRSMKRYRRRSDGNV